MNEKEQEILKLIYIQLNLFLDDLDEIARFETNKNILVLKSEKILVQINSLLAKAYQLNPGWKDKIKLKRWHKMTLDLINKVKVAKLSTY